MSRSARKTWRAATRALLALEQCSGLPAGARARAAGRPCAAERAPMCSSIRCSRAAPPGLRLDVRDRCEGLSLSGELARLVKHPPALTEPLDKPRFLEFFRKSLAPWIIAQAAAIHQLASKGVRLGGYGKGIAAIEAGLADMRFVEVVREVPLPDELASDEELKNVYYASARSGARPAKESRPRRGAGRSARARRRRRAARRARRARARSCFRSFMLDAASTRSTALLLPPLPPPRLSHASSAAWRRACPRSMRASSLPIKSLRIPRFCARCSSAACRARCAPGSTPASSRARGGELYARGLVELGQRYWRSEDFERARACSSAIRRVPKARSEAARLVSGLAEALRGGPQDAAEMMLRGPFLPEGVGDVSELDALAKTAGPIAGMAAYDAAFILQLVPPRAPTPAFWKDVAARFRASGAAARRPEGSPLGGRARQGGRGTARAAALINPRHAPARGRPAQPGLPLVPRVVSGRPLFFCSLGLGPCGTELDWRFRVTLGVRPRAWHGG